MGEELRYV